jgi:NCS1 family nucleobase:cation symporter-1
MGRDELHCVLDFRCFQVCISEQHDNVYPKYKWKLTMQSAATWQFGAGIITIGLSWRESLGIVALAFFMISFVIALNGATGVIRTSLNHPFLRPHHSNPVIPDHAPFPVLARASWGFWGSYVAIISRAILAIFWFAIQTMNGANTVRVMLGAIWPSFLTLPNHIPESQGIETNTMVAFILFWLAQVPFLYMHPNNLRWLFMAKSVIVPIAWIAILIWAFVATDGGEIFAQKATLEGSAYSWAFLGSLTSVIGNYATLSVNQVWIPLHP